ncbi:hypothetical protein GOV03_04885, partial [Candidatus Woesearchaeota archaeon]|nr:hypothetical protein [Candidatus Woesearchaeota archaeon]
MSHHENSSHSHKRFYLVLTTVVVGAILLLTLMNDGDKFDFFTGSSIGLISSEDKLIMKESIKNSGEIEIQLNFDTVPEVQEETRLDLIRVVFDDLNTNIKINEEELELKGLEKVEMEVRDFNGELIFDEISVSLIGESTSVMINGIEISTKGTMDISLGDLFYESLDIEGVQLNSVDFSEGSGNLAMAERLNYDLDQEQILLTGFYG